MKPKIEAEREKINPYKDKLMGKKERRKKKKMVLRERIELSTSPLPRECSTTELPQLFSIFALSCAILSENRQESICIFLQENVSYAMTYISYLFNI